MVNQSQFIERYGNSPKQCIGDIAKEWSKGQPFKKDNIIASGSTPCIHYGELFTKYGPYIDDVCSTTNDAAMKVSQVGDILFPASDVTPNGLTRCSAIMRSGVLLGGDIIILRLREGLSPEYTSYAICMQKQQLLECITGSVIKHLSAKSILNVKVPIPANRKDQDAFVAIMRQADKSKFAGFKSQFIEMFGNLPQDKKLAEISEIYDGVHQTPHYTDSGIKFISVEDISDIYGSKKYISIEDYNKYKHVPELGDLIMTRIGTIGLCAVVTKSEPLAYYVSVTLIKPNHNIIDSAYLKYYIESGYGQNELRMRSLLEAFPMKINLNEIGKVAVKVPSMESQLAFVQIVHHADKSKYLN